MDTCSFVILLISTVLTGLLPSSSRSTNCSLLGFIIFVILGATAVTGICCVPLGSTGRSTSSNRSILITVAVIGLPVCGIKLQTMHCL